MTLRREKVWVSSCSDHAHGAMHTRSPRIAAEKSGRVLLLVCLLVCSYAHDANDARQVCTALGLNPHDGRSRPIQQHATVPGRPSIRAPLNGTALGGRPVPASAGWRA